MDTLPVKAEFVTCAKSVNVEVNNIAMNNNIFLIIRIEFVIWLQIY